MRALQLIILLTMLVVSMNIYAENTTDIYHFSSRNEQQRYENLTQQIRCVVCQGQNIADSNALLARDLRRKVAQMVVAQQTDAQIKDYLVQRYGEYVLYMPRFNRATALLWLFPLIGVITILWVAKNLLRRAQQ